jgi:hypothetical protein
MASVTRPGQMCGEDQNHGLEERTKIQGFDDQKLKKIEAEIF